MKNKKSINILKGGKADNLSISDIAKMHKKSEKHILKQFILGIFIEREHTTDIDAMIEIAMDHLTENPNYYSDLKKMESEA